MKQVVIMPGGFHPFHAGHAALYQSARQAFPGADVYVAATNDTSERPFPFQVKEKLAQLAGVPKGRFMQVKSPFGAEEILAPYNADDTQLIFVKSTKNSRTGPSPEGPFPAEPDPKTGQLPLVTRGARKGLPVSDRLQYYQQGQPMAPMSRHSYLAYLPTVEFGPGMTSGSEIRDAWPKLNEKRKTALIMSLYPKTQSNPKLAANVVKMLDTAIGTEVAENQGWAATYESVGGMHAGYQDRYNQPVAEGWKKGAAIGGIAGGIAGGPIGAAVGAGIGGFTQSVYGKAKRKLDKEYALKASADLAQFKVFVEDWKSYLNQLSDSIYRDSGGDYLDDYNVTPTNPRLWNNLWEVQWHYKLEFDRISNSSESIQEKFKDIQSYGQAAEKELKKNIIQSVREQEQLSGNIRAVPKADSEHEWDYYYKDKLIDPGTDIHSKVKDLHFDQKYPGYIDTKDAISNAFRNPIKPGTAVPANKWPENQPNVDRVVPPSLTIPKQIIKDPTGRPIRLKDFVPHDPDIMEDYVEEDKIDPITSAAINFYQDRVGDIGPEPVKDYKKIARKLLGKTDNPSMREKIMHILVQGNKNPYIQGGVITTVGALLAGGILSSASRAGLSPQQTNILLQAVLNTVIPTMVSRVNGKSWKDTLKYTLASAGIGTGIAAMTETGRKK